MYFSVDKRHWPDLVLLQWFLSIRGTGLSLVLPQCFFVDRGTGLHRYYFVTSSIQLRNTFAETSPKRQSATLLSPRASFCTFNPALIRADITFNSEVFRQFQLRKTRNHYHLLPEVKVNKGPNILLLRGGGGGGGEFWSASCFFFPNNLVGRIFVSLLYAPQDIFFSPRFSAGFFFPQKSVVFKSTYTLFFV